MTEEVNKKYARAVSIISFLSITQRPMHNEQYEELSEILEYFFNKKTQE